jgi:protein O-mannosyl-transferase
MGVAASSVGESRNSGSCAVQPIPRYWLALSGACLLLAVLAAYANHFQNGFHFDDTHSVVTNPYIRSLANLPRFFTDARTSSSLPTNWNYRPLVSTSLALDYRMAGGLHPFWFHVSTFAWFLVQLALLFLLFRKILEITRPAPANSMIALFMVAWYGLHPAMAETVNYIIQRGDLYSTLGVVGGLCVWTLAPGSRKWGAYLVPVLLGAFGKVPALMFAPVLFLYILLFELPEPAYSFRNLRTAALQSLPAWLFSLAFGILHSAMTPKESATGGGPPLPYWATQPYVWLRYFLSFFYPNHLNADTDLTVLKFDDPRLFAGILFVVALLMAAWLTRQARELRPICFGIAWFCLASLPTSLVPLSEVENDHRMFFPFVGLTLAVVWSVVCLYRRTSIRIPAVAVLGLGSLLLVPYALATRERNRVWHSDESLWYDVTLKSPRNGRGLMNFGLTRMAAGDYKSALDYFNRALVYTPAYAYLEVNLGIANGGMNNDSEAEAHFRRALALEPNETISYYYYARWLYSKQRTPEAIGLLQRAIALNSGDPLPRYLLMKIYSQQADYARLAPLTEQTAKLYPEDPETVTYVNIMQGFQQRLAAAESLARTSPTPQDWLELSLLYHQAGRYQDCIAAATAALRLKPDYAEAYNNVAAAYQSLGEWDDAIRASQQALRLNPDLQIAKNNLAYSTWERDRARETSNPH